MPKRKMDPMIISPMVGRVGRHIYRNKAKYARYIQAGWRGYVARQKLKVGSRPGQTQSKVDKYITCEPENHSSKVLYVLDLTKIGQNVSTTTLNRRNRSIAIITGFSIRMHLRNLIPNGLVINFAVVKPISKNQVDGVGFFRDYQTSRDRDFTLGLCGMEFCYNSINTDKYRILWRKRVFMTPNEPVAANEGVRNGNNTKSFKTYIRLKRQIAYEDDPASEDAETKVWLLWWGDVPDNPSSAPVNADTFVTSKYIRTYFKEPRYTF